MEPSSKQISLRPIPVPKVFGALSSPGDAELVHQQQLLSAEVSALDSAQDSYAANVSIVGRAIEALNPFDNSPWASARARLAIVAPRERAVAIRNETIRKLREGIFQGRYRAGPLEDCTGPRGALEAQRVHQAAEAVYRQSANEYDVAHGNTPQQPTAVYGESLIGAQTRGPTLRPMPWAEKAPPAVDNRMVVQPNLVDPGMVVKPAAPDGVARPSARPSLFTPIGAPSS